MNQMILRGIPNEVRTALKRNAKKAGLSLNKTTILLLQKVLGLKDPSKKRDLRFMVNSMSENELREFQKNTKFLESIDKEIWLR